MTPVKLISEILDPPLLCGSTNPVVTITVTVTTLHYSTNCSERNRAVL